MHLLPTATLLALSLFGLADASLRDRLNAAGISALYPGDPSYANAATPFNKRFTYAPAAIAYPTSSQQVAAAVTAGNLEKVYVNARGGGHSYAAYAFGGENGHLMIDLSRLKNITVDATTNVATIQAGNRLGDTALALNSQGARALPHGTCPYVGIGGHASFGGYGFTSRMWGLTIDTVVGHEVVLANGSVFTTSATSCPDLFWALRGAAPSFGIITAYHMQTQPAPKSATTYSYNWQFTASQVAVGLEKFQQWVQRPDLPAEWGGEINLAKGSSKGLIKFNFDGAYYGTADPKSVIQSFLDLIGTPPTSDSKMTTSDWIDSLQRLAGGQALSTSGVDLSAEHDTFYVKSITTPASKPMSNASLVAYANYIANQGWSTTTQWFVQFELYGGAKSRITSIPADATAYNERSQLFTIQFYASSNNYQPPYPAEGFTFLDNMVATITNNNGANWPYGAYTNYVDPRLTTAQWQSQYYGSHFPRLQQIKRTYDPKLVFFWPQVIKPAPAPKDRKRTL